MKELTKLVLRMQAYTKLILVADSRDEYLDLQKNILHLGFEIAKFNLVNDADTQLALAVDLSKKEQ